MQQCQIYNNNSLNFFRTVCAILALIAFLIQNQWLVLITGLLTSLGVFSMRLNIPYQFHLLFLKKVVKEQATPIQKDSGELKFVYGFTAILFFIGFLMLYCGKCIDLAWILVLVVSFLMFLASFANVCVASIMYVFFKKIFKKNK